MKVQIKSNYTPLPNTDSHKYKTDEWLSTVTQGSECLTPAQYFLPHTPRAMVWDRHVWLENRALGYGRPGQSWPFAQGVGRGGEHAGKEMRFIVLSLPVASSLCLSCLTCLMWNLELHFLMCLPIPLFYEILWRMLTCLSNRGSLANLSGTAPQEAASASTNKSSRTLNTAQLSLSSSNSDINWNLWCGLGVPPILFASVGFSFTIVSPCFGKAGK